MAASAAGRRPPRRRGAAATAALLAACTLLLLPGGARGLEYMRDETLWMKQRWAEWRLPFPWAAVKQRDAEATRQLQGPLAGFPLNSMNGPLLDGAALAAKAEEAAHKALGGGGGGSLELSLLDGEASQEVAAAVASCKVCGSLTKQLWAGLTAWVDRRRLLPSHKAIAAYAAELCEYEVPNEVLGEWVLLRARVQPTPAAGLPFALDGQGAHEFYLLSKRVKQHATPPEIEAVRLACRKLVHEDAATGERSELLHQAAPLAGQYHSRLLAHLHRHDTHAAPQGAAEASAQPVDQGPRAERRCYNRHPQCAYWVGKGECEGNPVYMKGQGGQDGWCRPACGVCTPRDEPPALKAADAEEMGKVATRLYALLQTQACLNGQPCKWAAGEGSSELLSKAKEGMDTEAAALMEAAEFVSGPVRPHDHAELAAALDPARLKDSRPVLVRDLSDTVVPPPEGALKGEGPPEPLERGGQAARLLWEDLGGRCLYLSAGWWWYEVCYGRHLTQFHMDDKHKVDWTIQLGLWESSDWGLNATTSSGLYPDLTRVPYLSHRYARGNHCDRDPDPESGAARPPIRRSAELRLMCSPDGEQHLVVVEPDQCQYVVELYTPRLCGLDGMAVAPPPGGWPRHADGEGGHPHDAVALGAQAVDDPYLDPPSDEDADDPYVHPDEL